MEQEINNKQIRCPRLGDEISLSYCLKESGDMPCSRIISCWSPYFSIEGFLKEKLMPEKWDNFINFQSKDKIPSLIELIEKAKAKK
jgi:hypothetical protein